MAEQSVTSTSRHGALCILECRTGPGRADPRRQSDETETTAPPPTDPCRDPVRHEIVVSGSEHRLAQWAAALSTGWQLSRPSLPGESPIQQHGSVFPGTGVVLGAGSCRGVQRRGAHDGGPPWRCCSLPSGRRTGAELHPRQNGLLAQSPKTLPTQSPKTSVIIYPKRSWPNRACGPSARPLSLALMKRAPLP